MKLKASAVFSGLSNDPHTASFELLNKVNEGLLKAHPSETDYSEACGLFEAFYEANGWKIPDRLSDLSHGTSIEGAIDKARSVWRLQYEGYRRQIMVNHTFCVKRDAKEAIAAITSSEFGYAVLDSEEKRNLHFHIEKIREIIQGSNIDDRKKNSLFERLSALAAEIDRNGTRTDRFFAFASEAGFCLGQFATSAKPLFDEIKDLLRIVTRARARHDGIKLPPSDEILSLPEPTEMTPAD